MSRDEMIQEIRIRCKELNISYPKGYPDDLTDDQMQKWIECWDEYDPFPELN